MVESVPVHVGNAAEDGAVYRGWIVGPFVDGPDDPRATGAVEVKWSTHPAGRVRPGWTEDGTRTTVLVLVSGRFRLDLEDRSVVLSRGGDYVVWGAGGSHTWRALDASVTMTVRWPAAASTGVDAR